MESTFDLQFGTRPQLVILIFSLMALNRLLEEVTERVGRSKLDSLRNIRY